MFALKSHADSMKLAVPIVLVAVCALTARLPAHADTDATPAVCLPSFTNSDDARRAPSIDVEILWTDDYGGRNDIVDLFVLVTNPNDFDVYVGDCGGCTVSTEWHITNGDGSVCDNREEFTLVPAKGKHLLNLLRNYRLGPGTNHFHVVTRSAIDPKAALPWNYVVTGTREFKFVIVNEDSLTE